jgi:ABC-type Fe3+/spermidine/putrescine transport system ATPase subunit
MRSEIRELQKRLGDHHGLRHARPGRSDAVSDRIAVMSQGTVVQEGTAEISINGR